MSEFFDKATLPNDFSDLGPALASHLGRLFIAWRGSGNENLNVASGNLTDLDIPGTSSETSDIAPALSWLDGGIYLAWKGAGNDNLNALAVVADPRQLQGIPAK